jgi:hypothetical protein
MSDPHRDAFYFGSFEVLTMIFERCNVMKNFLLALRSKSKIAISKLELRFRFNRFSLNEKR